MELGSSIASLNSCADRCLPTLFKLYSVSLSPSATNLFFTLIINFINALFPSITASFIDIEENSLYPPIDEIKLSQIKSGILNCALIPS